jgi:taurine transport system permease protein
MAVLAAEMLGAKSGVGFLITRGMDSGDTALIFVSMIIIGVIGAILAVLTSNLERWLCPWARETAK